MAALQQYEVWFVTGSQHLYGEETLREVADHARVVSTGLNASSVVPVDIVNKPVMTTADAIEQLCLDANAAPNCIGLITWMHTFSPAKMWIPGLRALQKPLVHLHTQFNRDIPWDTIDMDFMNLNQSAHGGREFGFMVTRLGIEREVIVGHWESPDVHAELAAWMRTAAGRAALRRARIARFGDNMREVAVTEGDKVEAQIRFGYSVSGYGVGDLAAAVDAVQDSDVERLMEEYEVQYTLADELKNGGERRDSLREGARMELGMLSFLKDGAFSGFTTTFENLYGIPQLPGLAVQRLMAKGYGFGAEGDWKTAALVHTMKVMASGLSGGTSFMEDYTYHLHPNGMKVLGAHMLEVCESTAAGKPSLQIHPLSIGGKDDPLRLVFDTQTGPAVNVCIVDLGHRFRVIVNSVDVTESENTPKLPVAKALWKPHPDLKTAAACWILAGGAHHTGFSLALRPDHFRMLASMLDIECIMITHNTTVSEVRSQLRWNSTYYDQKRI